tara:strand:- start:3 stop:146 length:144 start_codon:yes stop_codon:yes gene_type:complete
MEKSALKQLVHKAAISESAKKILRDRKKNMPNDSLSDLYRRSKMIFV